MNTPTKQTVYRPSNVEDGSKYRIFDLHECEGDFIQNVTEGYGYFFSSEQLNEYTQEVIKQALETAAEKVEHEEYKFDGKQPPISKQAITNTFEETYKKFKL